MSNITNSVAELIYASTSVGATLATFTTEAQLNTVATMGVQAHLPADFWLPNLSQVGRGIRLVARGVLSSAASAPTFTWTIRGGVSGNVTTDSPIWVGSAAVTAGSSLTNAFWQLEADVILTAIAQAGTHSTIRGVGQLLMQSSTSTGATLMFPLWGGATSPGTDANLDTSVANYINVNAACGTSSASNTITLDQLLVFGLN